jgi:hypothetical protein
MIKAMTFDLVEPLAPCLLMLLVSAKTSVKPGPKPQTTWRREMKSTALVSASVLASVMVCGCVATNNDDSKQEEFGSVEQAATVTYNWFVMANCSGGYTGLKAQVNDQRAANALYTICGRSTSSVRYPSIISATSRDIYNNNGTKWESSKKFWFTPATSGDSRFNNLFSCKIPFIHKFWVDGWNTGANCRAAGQKYYNDFTSTTRSSTCTWVKTRTNYLNACNSVGRPVASDCSNLLGFDPGSTLANTLAGGWGE